MAESEIVTANRWLAQFQNAQASHAAYLQITTIPDTVRNESSHSQSTHSESMPDETTLDESMPDETTSSQDQSMPNETTSNHHYFKFSSKLNLLMLN